MNKFFAILVAVIIVLSGAYFFLQGGEGSYTVPVTPSENPGDGTWVYTKPNAQGIQFQYPRALPTTYISAASPEGWPPQVVLEGGDYSCAEEQQKMVGDREYCVVETSEGTAGSVFKTYEYITAQGDLPDGEAGFIARVKFTLQFPQCVNYGEDEQLLCESEQASFDVDGLADRIAESIRML